MSINFEELIRKDREGIKDNSIRSYLIILKKLNERKEADSFRSLSIASDGIDFYSNDYLGIAKLKNEKDVIYFLKNKTYILKGRILFILDSNNQLEQCLYIK